MDGSYVYTITVTDEFGLESNVEFTVNVVAATPLEVLNGVLFNAGGPAGTGGLDMDNGMSTGSTDEAAEIKDQGIDSQSGTVTAGDIFVVERAGTNYAFQVAEVNVIQADNSDNYVLNIVK